MPDSGGSDSDSSASSRSRSPNSPPRKQKNLRAHTPSDNEEEFVPKKSPPLPKKEDEEEANNGTLQEEALNVFGRTGGAYIPPAKLRAMQASIKDRSSVAYQRMSWEALKKSLNGLINKVNVSNLKNIVPEIFSENLIRGRGLLCRSLMKAQAASPTFTAVYAGLVAIINTKFPRIVALLLGRLTIQFRRAYRRNDKAVCLASVRFLAHLTNQGVVNELLVFEILALLLERPTDDSVEVAVGLMRECGAYLSDTNMRVCNELFDRFRAILNEGAIDKRTQYMIEVLFQVRKDKFKDNPAIIPELDLVEEEDQIVHYVELDEELDPEEMLNVFKEDPNFMENEEKYKDIKKEILGDESDEGEDGEEGTDDEDEDEEAAAADQAREQMKIKDMTDTNLVNLRRDIYLTIMSALSFEECCHKLMKLNISEGQEYVLCDMIIECCSNERTYISFYGFLGERFSKLHRMWADAFANCFEKTYKEIHRYETNRLRNIAKYFSHLLATDAITWHVFALIRLTEVDTTSSSRIFLKIILEEIVSALGIQKLKERLADPTMVIAVQTENGQQTRGVFDGLFPKDPRSPKDTRFAINYFTAIKLGILSEDLRVWLKNVPNMIKAQAQATAVSDSDSSDSSDSDDSESDSDSSDSSSSDSSDSDSDSTASSASSPPRKAAPVSNNKVSSANGTRSLDNRPRNLSPPMNSERQRMLNSTIRRDDKGGTNGRASPNRRRSPEGRKSPDRRRSPERRRSPDTRRSPDRREGRRSPGGDRRERRRSPDDRHSPDRRKSPARRRSPEDRRSPDRRRSPVRPRSRHDDDRNGRSPRGNDRRRDEGSATPPRRRDRNEGAASKRLRSRSDSRSSRSSSSNRASTPPRRRDDGKRVRRE
ncbi:MIF4G-domain-containing protein [Cladochytrium replicatum]|nr:MIF4G-domain-containing protein [Cladochytrium replicatum]